MMNRLLLCTDLDRTLLPNGSQPESALARERFRSFVSRNEVTLVYVTGRHKALVQEAIDAYQVPVPDYVIADVGSTIYRIDGDDWQYWDQWEREIDWQWNGKSHEDIQDLLKGVSDLRLQERSKQNKHKLSYYIPLHVDQAGLAEKLEGLFQTSHINANLVWSIDDSENTGLLDILPGNASKRHAIEFLAEQLGFDIDHVIFAGDSGNDISVMASRIHSVLVANASPEVVEMATREAKKNNLQHSLYVARGNFMGMNGNYSAGILEGVVHYIPSLERHIENGID